MNYNNLALYCSTSIENFREKLKRRFDLPRWHFLRSMGKHAIFFGMYHEWDVFRFIWHRGKKTVFWCGGDILNIQKRPFLRWLILRLSDARHICENIVEQEALLEMGIESDIHPCLFDKMDDIEVSYQWKERPQVYLVAHEGREREYGVDIVEEIAHKVPEVDFHIYGIRHSFHESWYDSFSESTKNIDYVQLQNVFYHGKVPEKQFNEEIKGYQCALRLNKFDGFSEILGKSILMGQYQYSVIPYPYMDSGNLIHWLRTLEWKKKPNIEGRNYWKAKLTESLYEIIR